MLHTRLAPCLTRGANDANDVLLCQQVGGTHEHIIPMAVEDTAQARQAEVSQTVSQTQAAATTENVQTQSSAAQQSEQGSLKLVPITQKGAFLSDSFFDDARRRFEALTQRSDATSSLVSNRSLLRRNFRLAEQEAHVEEDARALKVSTPW